MRLNLLFFILIAALRDCPLSGDEIDECYSCYLHMHPMTYNTKLSQRLVLKLQQFIPT